MGIPERLKEVRQQAGMTQELLSEAIGVTKRSVINWETGAAAPGADALAKYADAGIDVLYIVTGERSQSVPARAELPKDQQALLNSYEMCGPEARKNLLKTAALFAAGESPARMGNSVTTGNVTGNGQVAGGNINSPQGRSRR